jgi:uncharacterized membrane protein YgcG
MPGDFDSDAMLAFIGQMGKEVDNLKAKITGLNETGGKGMGNLADQTERFGKTIQRYTSGPVKAMDAAVSGLTKTLVGAGGLALSLAGIAKAFDVFSVGELKIRNFATNTGFSVDSVKNLRTQLSAAGIDAGEASKGIASIGAKLQEVLALQQTSSFYREIEKSSPILAEQIRQLVNAGNQQGALNLLQKAYNEGGERFKAWLPTATGLSRAMFEAGKVGMEGLIAPWHFNDDQALKYHKTMTNLETIGNGVWTSMTYTMLEGISKMIDDQGGIGALDNKAHTFADNFKKYFNEDIMPQLRALKEGIGWVVDGIGEIDKFITKWSTQKNAKTGKDEQTSLGALVEHGPHRFLTEDIWKKKEPEQAAPPESSETGKGWWEWLKEKISFTTDAGASELEPGAMPGVAKDIADTDKDSNRMLHDMRDVLQKWDQKQDGVTGTAPSAGVGGGGGGGAGGGFQGGGGGSGGAGASTSSGGPPGLPDVASATPPSGSLATQRAGFMKELENNPRLKSAAIDLAQREGGVQSNLEQLFNYASMRGMTIAQAMNSGQYGPVKHGLVTGNISPALQAKGEAALKKVYEGSNITNYATDQGMRGDPNFAKYMANPGYWGMHKVEGAWFSSHGERGRKWAEQQRWSDQQRQRNPTFNDMYRDRIDSALRGSGSSTSSSTATVDVVFGDRKVGSSLMSGASPFIKTNIQRSPQAPIAGGGVSDFNSFAFE